MMVLCSLSRVPFLVIGLLLTNVTTAIALYCRSEQTLTYNQTYMVCGPKLRVGDHP